MSGTSIGRKGPEVRPGPAPRGGSAAPPANQGGGKSRGISLPRGTVSQRPLNARGGSEARPENQGEGKSPGLPLRDTVSRGSLKIRTVPPNPADTLTNYINRASELNDTEQLKISNNISNGTFGNPIPNKLALAIAKHLGKFTSPDARIIIAHAITGGALGREAGKPMHPDVALAIANKLDMFKDPQAQPSISLAIDTGTFGEPMLPDVALAIANKLDMFKDPEAQGYVSNAIATGKFRDPMPPKVALAIANKLGMFTEPEAQKSIALAINTFKFGKKVALDPAERLHEDVAFALVKNLGKFTSEDAKEIILKAISSGFFKNPIDDPISKKGSSI